MIYRNLWSKKILIWITVIILGFGGSAVLASCWRTSEPDCPSSAKETCNSAPDGQSASGTACYTSAGGSQRCCHDYECDTNCGGPPKPPPCEDKSPDAPGLVSPADNEFCFDSNTIVLDWNAIGGWGKVCDGNESKSYTVYVDGVNVGSYGDSTTQHTYTGTWGTTHSWFVRASNGNDSKDSATWHFRVSTCARVIGRVWEDVNANSYYDGTVAESWSQIPPKGATCAALTDNDLNVGYNQNNLVSVLAGWGCNGPSSVAYYHTQYFHIDGPKGTTRNIDLKLWTPDPVDYPNQYVKWDYARCSTASPTCTPWISKSGVDTNVANIDISNNYDIHSNNHLSWQLLKNVPPTAAISGTSDGVHEMTTVNSQNVIIVPTGSPTAFAAAASETKAIGSWSLGIGRRPFNPSTRYSPNDVATFLSLGSNNACTGLNCNVTLSDSSVPAGYYVYYPIARDEISISSGTGRSTNQCNGHPGVHTGVVDPNLWADCDINHADGYQDEAIVFGDRRPVCNGISGPTTMFSYPDGQPYVYPESVGWYNMSATDLDRTEVKHQWEPSWTNPDGLFPTINQIKIFAYGSQSNSVGPTMQLWLGHNDTGGSRNGPSPVWETVVNNTTLSEFTINGPFNNVSSLEVVFPNDAFVNGDRNLYINRLEVMYEVEPGRSLVKTLYPVSTTGDGDVYYDRGDNLTVAPYSFNATFFDGEWAGAPAPRMTSAGYNGYPAGYMMWSGTLSFPIPIRSSTLGATLPLGGTPLSTLPFYDGLACAGYNVVHDPNPTYTISGTMYQRNQSLTCSAQNINDPSITKITSTLVSLQDESGSLIPGLSATTDAITGTYTISGVPVHYRPDPFCANCGAKVCLDQMDPDVGVYLAACQQMQPPVSALNDPWGDSRLCSNKVSIDPQITLGSLATVNLGFDYYQNEKWSTVVDGDVYAPGVNFDIATNPGTNFSPNLITRRVDSVTPTLGGYAFIDDSDVTLGLPLTFHNLVEAGGYAFGLSNITGYNFKDTWISNYYPVAPSGSTDDDPRTGNHYNFHSDRIYSYTLDQFKEYYNNSTNSWYDVTGPRKTAIIYVTGNPLLGDKLELNRSVRTSDPEEIVVIVTNLPVEIPDDLEIDSTQLTGNTFNVNTSSFGTGTDQITTGYLDFVVLSVGDISFDSRYDDTVDPVVHDLPVMVYGGLLSKSGVRLNRDLWHILNSDYPSEMVRYYFRLVPELMQAEYAHTDLSSFTGLSVFDVQTVYE